MNKENGTVTISLERYQELKKGFEENLFKNENEEKIIEEEVNRRCKKELDIIHNQLAIEEIHLKFEKDLLECNKRCYEQEIREKIENEYNKKNEILLNKNLFQRIFKWNIK